MRKCVFVNGTGPEDFVEKYNRAAESLEVVDQHHVSAYEILIYYEGGETAEHCDRKCAECSRYKWGIGCIASGELALHRPSEDACPSFSTDPIYETEVDDYKEARRHEGIH